VGNEIAPCGHKDSHVADTRMTEDGYRRRRYECNQCGQRFSTIEVEFKLTKGKNSIDKILEAVSSQYSGLSPRRLAAVKEIVDLFLD
jgi:transcriptional regulator NrdR family protein